MFQENTEDDNFDLFEINDRGVLNKVVVDDNVMDEVEMLEDDGVQQAEEDQLKESFQSFN